MKGIVRLLFIILVFALGVVCIIGSNGGGGGSGSGGGGDEAEPGGENGGSGDNNAGLLVGAWFCTMKYTDTYGGEHTSSSDIEYFADGSYEANHNDIPCTSRGSWDVVDNQLTEKVTSVSGLDNTCNIDNWDTAPLTITITSISQDAFSTSRTSNGIIFNASCNR